MADRPEQALSGVAGVEMDVEGDVQIEGPGGHWTVSGQGRSIRVEIPSLFAGWRLAKDRRLFSIGQRCLRALGAEMTVSMRGVPVGSLGARVSGNLWGRLAGLGETDVKPGGVLRTLLPNKRMRPSWVETSAK